MKVLISVVLPAYNCGKTIGRAIESIIRQSVTNWELIIVYDKSSDNTLDVIKEYINKECRIRLVESKEKKGIAAALNLGIKNAKGTYIARMDADDISYKERFEMQLDYLNKNPSVTICGTGFRMVFRKKAIYPPIYENSNDIKAAMLYCCPLAHPTVMVKNTLFEEYEYDEDVFVEDYELWFRVSDRFSMGNINCTLLDYNYDGNNNSEIFKNKVFEKTVACRRKYLKRYLGINSQSYEDEIIGLEMGPRYLRNNYACLAKLLSYLLDIEKHNFIKHFYDERSLNKAIIEMWNRGVSQAYFWDETIENGLDLRIDEDDIKWTKKLLSIFNVTEIVEVKNNLIRIMSNKEYPFSFDDTFIIFGTGNECKKYMDEYYSLLNIAAFADSDKDKQGKVHYGKRIISPAEISNYKYDYILISSFDYYREIKNILENKCNIPSNVILPIHALNFA